MGRSKGTGSTISMSHEINIKGPGVKIHGTKVETLPDLTTPTPDISSSFAVMLPALTGSIPMSAGTCGSESPLVMAALGSVCASAGIDFSPAPNGSGYVTTYKNVLQFLTNGAHVQKRAMDEEKLKKMMMAVISDMLEEAGPAFSSWNAVLIDLMQNATLQDFMKGVQSSVCAMIKDPVNANTGNFIYQKEDLCVNGRDSLLFKRSYNRIDKRKGCMGRGWCHNYEIRLLIEEDRYIILWEDGREELYLRDKDHTPVPLFGGFSRLTPINNGYFYETQEKVTYMFDLKGRLIKQKDLNGQELRFLYDKHDRLSSAINGYGSSLSYVYDGNSGLLTKVKDHSGRTVTLTYELGRLICVENAIGARYTYSYDSDKNIHEIRNPQGARVLRNVYDKQGRTIRQILADGGEIVYDYEEELNRTLVTEQNGNRVSYVHDERFRNVKTVYSDGEETFSYNERNQLIKKTDKNGNMTKFSYDDRGNTSQIIYPDGEKHNMTYDADNRLLVQSVNGSVKLRNLYDEKGNLIKTTDALGLCREIRYDNTGKPVRLIQPDGSALLFDYDDHGNISKITDAAGNSIVYEYDPCNRVVCTTDGNGNHTRFSYDDSNQITCVTNAAGKQCRYEYTKSGKLAKIIDFNGAVTALEYNNMNQVKSVFHPDGGILHMEYDLMHNIARKILPNGAEVFFDYNGLNRLERITLPGGGIVCYEYDPNGNRTAEIDPDGNRTVMEYDERNRLIKRTDPAGATTEYDYDKNRNIIRRENHKGDYQEFTYDCLDQLIKVRNNLGQEEKYTYNEVGKDNTVFNHCGQTVSKLFPKRLSPNYIKPSDYLRAKGYINDVVADQNMNNIEFLNWEKMAD